MTSDYTNLARTWIFKNLWGMPEPDGEGYEIYYKALLCCANGDGVLSQEERDYVAGMCAAEWGSPNLIELLKTYAAADDVLQLIAQSPLMNSTDGRRFLIYDAIRACSADKDYSANEQGRVEKIASVLGMTSDVVKQIEQIIADEDDLKLRRLHLLRPELVSRG